MWYIIFVCLSYLIMTCCVVGYASDEKGRAVWSAILLCLFTTPLFAMLYYGFSSKIVATYYNGYTND